LREDATSPHANEAAAQHFPRCNIWAHGILAKTAPPSLSLHVARYRRIFPLQMRPLRDATRAVCKTTRTNSNHSCGHRGHRRPHHGQTRLDRHAAREIPHGANKTPWSSTAVCPWRFSLVGASLETLGTSLQTQFVVRQHEQAITASHTLANPFEAAVAQLLPQQKHRWARNAPTRCGTAFRATNTATWA
jgi:hypothetical protein